MGKKIKRIIKVSGIGLSTAFVGLSICAAVKQKDSQYGNEPEARNPFEGKKVEFIYDETDKENADGVKGHLIAVGDAEENKGLYERYGKRAVDLVLSFGGLVALSPIFAATAIARNQRITYFISKHNKHYGSNGIRNKQCYGYSLIWASKK